MVERQQSFQRNVFGHWVMVEQQLTRGKQCIVQGGSGDQQDMQGQLTLGIEHGRAGWIKRHEQLCRSCECQGGQGGVSKEAMERCPAGGSGDETKRCFCRDLGQDLIELVDVGGVVGGGGGGEVVQEWVVGYRGDGVEAGQLTKSDGFVFRVGMSKCRRLRRRGSICRAWRFIGAVGSMKKFDRRDREIYQV